tara:strand:- start:981 stop:1538 length:558 start_codon:yes stop_codon:yes gene_type:complete
VQHSAFLREAVKLAEGRALPKKLAPVAQQKLKTEAKKEKTEKRKDVLRKVDAVRPYGHRAFVTGIPAGWLGGWATKTKLNPGGTRAGHLGGLAIGAAMGVADKRLHTQSKKRGYKTVLKSYQEKAAAMGGDMRLTGSAGVKRPPFRTESSVTGAARGVSKSNSASALPGTHGAGPSYVQQTPLTR